MKKVILASASPRRKALLEQAGIPCEVIPSRINEKTVRTRPNEIVMDLSEQKAEDVRKRYVRNGLIIGADTIVAIDDEILGKPQTTQEAEEMIAKLAGRTHQVYTGVTLLLKEHGKVREKKTFYEKTDVTFYPMTKKEIWQYVMEGESLDKAGAYAIQGIAAIYVKHIEGDYNNVVGLPVAAVYHMMKQMKVSFDEPNQRLRELDNNKYRIRQMKETDIKRVAEIEAEYLSEHDAQEVTELIRTYQARSESFYIAETVDGKIIGFCEGITEAKSALTKSLDKKLKSKDARETLQKLISIFVVPDYRCQGIGTALMFHALKDAKVKSKDCVQVNCEKSSVAFYNKLGFRTVGEPKAIGSGKLLYMMNGPR